MTAEPWAKKEGQTICDDMMRAEVMALVDALISVLDEIGLEEVCSEVEYDLDIADDRKVKRLPIGAVREMLGRGARVDFDSGVPTGSIIRRERPTKLPCASTVNGALLDSAYHRGHLHFRVGACRHGGVCEQTRSI